MFMKQTIFEENFIYDDLCHIGKNYLWWDNIPKKQNF